MEDSGERSVRWTEAENSVKSENLVNVGYSRKRYATRDQPTWINCKLRRPSSKQSQVMGNEKKITNYEVTNCNEEGHRTMSSHSNRSNKSSRVLSARSSISRVTSTISILSKDSGKTFSEMCTTRPEDGHNSLEQASRNGRSILMQRAKQMLPATHGLPQTMERGGSSESWDTDAYRSLGKFRVSSAECTHRGPDVSIGLRHISRMLRQSPSGPTARKVTQTARSSSALESLVDITSQNLARNRRCSEPIISLGSTSSNDNWKELGPGEGDTRQRRRSSSSAPATKGGGSVLNQQRSLREHCRPRPLPKACIAPDYTCQEWRPPALHKYSVKRPWASLQRSTRYFPCYTNLQDVHCRNPYSVPGSILYKPLPTDPRQ